MLSLILVLLLFISSPFLLAGVAAKSVLIGGVGLVLAALYVFLFLVNGFSEFLSECRAEAVDAALDARLQKLWREAGPERTDARFWIYPDSGAHFKVWVSGARKLEVFFSQGLLNLATDQGLKAAFSTMGGFHLSDIKLQNRQHALSVRFERLKGPKEDFRYWALSFWLYPLERLLKIAKI